uniref:Death domain-containing protein n=1 Tax=Amphimedon queenslandica TaxID=400682 RepID=A0A1X7TJT2_AMPQE
MLKRCDTLSGSETSDEFYSLPDCDYESHVHLVSQARPIQMDQACETNVQPAGEHFDLVDESKKKLSIKDLKDVLAILKKHHFDSSNYFDFCLYLGLLLNTIKEFEMKCRGDPQACLREGLAKWLMKADNVSEIGDPTWYTLLEALRILDNALADRIDKEKHAACFIFTHHISEDFIRNSCFKKSSIIYVLLVQEMKLKSSESANSSKLYSALKTRICLSYENLQILAAILEKDSTTRNIGEIVMQDYMKVFDNDDAVNSEETDSRAKSVSVSSDASDVFGDDFATTPSKTKSVSVSSDISNDFKKRRTRFAATFDKVSDVVTVSVDRLKKYLQYYLEYDADKELSKCETVADILNWISKQCSLTNIELLEATVERFEIDGAVLIIDKYKEENQKFVEKMTLDLCLDEHFSPPPVLQLEEIKFVVDKNLRDCTVKDVDKFIQEAATKTLSTHVKLSVIRRGNSFSIVCSFPVVLSERLISIALKNLKVLKDNGLLKLTIGYCTVYDYKDESLCYPEEGEAF